MSEKMGRNRNRTGLEIQTDVYQMVRESPLASEIRGGVYHYGTRPRGAEEAEDVVVRFTAGLAGQVSRGVVTILIFVPDLKGRDGRLMDFARVRELERVASEWAGDTLRKSPRGYRFELAEAVQTMRDEETRSHFISVQLRYEILEIM